MKIGADVQTAGTVPDTVTADDVQLAAAGKDRATRSAVVRLLMESGSITAGEIGAKLGMSAAGARRHLDALVELGDVETHAIRTRQQLGRGRPAKRYRLTAAGRSKLGHRYDDLALAALRQLREIGGEDAVRAFARRRIDNILAEVTPVDGTDAAAVEKTAAQIATALSKAGYAATTAPVNGAVSGIQILQHHCPVADVAREFPELCYAERQAMAEMLGTHVQRLATIADGSFVCTTHVPLTSKRR